MAPTFSSEWNKEVLDYTPYKSATYICVRPVGVVKLKGLVLGILGASLGVCNSWKTKHTHTRKKKVKYHHIITNIT